MVATGKLNALRLHERSTREVERDISVCSKGFNGAPTSWPFFA